MMARYQAKNNRTISAKKFILDGFYCEYENIDFLPAPAVTRQNHQAEKTKWSKAHPYTYVGRHHQH